MPRTAPALQRSMWLAVLVGWLAQLSLSEVLPLVADVIGRAVAMGTGQTDSWVDHTRETAHTGWYVVQGLVFVASCAAGALAAHLAPGRLKLLALLLVVLSLLGSTFMQLPAPPRTLGLVLLWLFLPCVGLVVGMAGYAMRRGREASRP